MNNDSQTKKIYLGIDFLRFLLCFWIVLFHCSNFRKHYKYFWRLFHVPTFFVIAFYFFYPLLYKRIIEKIKIRFQRLLIPYIIWPLLLFFLNNINIKIICLDTLAKTISLKDLFTQIVLGKGIHGVFWFQNNLLFLSLFFSIISFLFKNNFMPIFHFLTSASLYLHYSGKSYIEHILFLFKN